MQISKGIIKILGAIESGAKTARTVIADKGECQGKLETAKAALLLIVNTDCLDHLPCTSSTLLKRIALEALDKIK